MRSVLLLALSMMTIWGTAAAAGTFFWGDSDLLAMESANLEKLYSAGVEVGTYQHRGIDYYVRDLSTQNFSLIRCFRRADLTEIESAPAQVVVEEDSAFVQGFKMFFGVGKRQATLSVSKTPDQLCTLPGKYSLERIPSPLEIK